MLTCITCSKQLDDEEDNIVGTCGSKDTVKNLTTQMKDITVKVSGSTKGKGKPPRGPSSIKQGGHNICKPPNPFMQPDGSSSTPAWDFGGGFEPPRQSSHLVLDDNDDPIEWMAQVDRGVQITLVPLSDGKNDLKRIRFDREMFDKWQARSWWGQNYDRIMELYNVQRFNCQALGTPSRSEDEGDSSHSRLGSVKDNSILNPLKNYYQPPEQGGKHHSNAGPSAEREQSTTEASRMTTSSIDEASVSISNANDVDSEWIKEVEPGVYITIRQLLDGTRDLRRVRFSHEKFGEVHAKLWLEQNREKIQSHYL